MMTMSEAIEALGGTTRVAAYCRVGLPAVSLWTSSGKFPTRRLLQIEALALEQGVTIPRELFDFFEPKNESSSAEAAA